MSDRKESFRAVLGVDAAWTAAEPSGVALAVEADDGWRLEAVEASYGRFFEAAAGVESGGRPWGAEPDASALIASVRSLCGRTPDCVAVDMPIGPWPIVCRRTCDDAISRLYGARKATVHSPSAARPGPISDRFRAGFEALGLKVRTAPPAHGVIEVYPHAALIEFLEADERLPYKAGKTVTYWPDHSAEGRHRKLRAVWSRIVEALDRRIAGVAASLPVPPPDERGWRLKAFEDKLDAVVCAAVGVAALNGAAVAHGDADGAIWVPRRRRDGVGEADALNG